MAKWRPGHVNFKNEKKKKKKYMINVDFSILNK